MNLATADKYAEKIRSELAPMCEKIAVAGSIRRRRPEPGDIDIVALPRSGQRDAIRARCLQSGPAVMMDGEEQLIFRLANGVQVDIYFATWPRNDLFRRNAGTWGTRLLCRTGSRTFNIWLAGRAKRMHMHWNPYWGIYRAGICLAAETEQEIFKLLELDFIKPEDREK